MQHAPVEMLTSLDGSGQGIDRREMAHMETMTSQERQWLVQYLTDSHNQVLDTVRKSSEPQSDFRENPGRWSIAENVEHLTIVHNLVLSHIQNLTAAPTPAEAHKSQWEGRDDALLAQIRSRENPLKVPDAGNPRNQLKHDELFQQFEAVRDRVVEFAATTRVPLRSFCFPHPVFGQKGCYQWLLGTGAHCERHLAQIREVMSANAFPN